MSHVAAKIIGSGAFVLVLVTAFACTRPRVMPRPRPIAPTPTPMPLGRTVDSVVSDIGPRVRARLAPYFEHASVGYPPSAVAFLAFKDERRLEIWARTDDASGAAGVWMPIDARPILAASGGPGPKLRQGDRQVPEGLYRLVAFNPNSRFHLSMKLDYPNAFDLAAADVDGRMELGGDIFIHGDDRSIGCIAMGDPGIEDLFVLVADVGLERARMIVAPRDPRAGGKLVAAPGLPFTVELYRQIEAGLAAFSLGPCLPEQAPPGP
ncbi:MAG: L,D-transpeptidase family protein [Candidatus Binatia bacterium]